MTSRIPRVTAAAWLRRLWLSSLRRAVQSRTALAHDSAPHNQVLEWNQIFIDTLIATNTPNSSSQRLGAIVHTAIFDAYNGIERRYTTNPRAPGGGPWCVAPSRGDCRRVHGAGRPVPVPAVGVGCQLCRLARGAGEDDEDRDASRHARRAWQSRERGIAWGTEVAQAVLARRANDGFSGSYPAFSGGTAVGQWRPVAPATAMSAQGLAFTDMFVLVSNSQFRPPAPRTLGSADVCGRLQRRQGAWSQDRLDAHRGADGARSFLGRQRKRSLESGSKPDCARPPPFDLQRQPASRGVEHRDGRHGFDHLERQAILWRRCDGGDMAADYRHHAGSDRWQSGHGSRRRLAASRHYAVPPGISCRASQSQRGGREHSSRSLQRPTNIHAHDARTAEPHVYQHHGRRARTVTTRECGAACTIRARSQSAMQLGRAIARYVNRNSMQRLHRKRH